MPNGGIRRSSPPVDTVPGTLAGNAPKISAVTSSIALQSVLPECGGCGDWNCLEPAEAPGTEDESQVACCSSSFPKTSLFQLSVCVDGLIQQGREVLVSLLWHSLRVSSVSKWSRRSRPVRLYSSSWSPHQYRELARSAPPMD